VEIAFYGTTFRSIKVISEVYRNRDNKLFVEIGYDGNPDVKMRIGLIELREVMKNVERSVDNLGGKDVV